MEKIRDKLGRFIKGVKFPQELRTKISLGHKEINREKNFTKEHKRKISISLKKYFNNHFAWNKGKKGVYSNETKMKMSISNKNRIYKKGNQSPIWRGGRIIRNGYTAVYRPNHPFSNCDGYIREHRLVMERHLGRYLKLTEYCHHINGIKTDNRIENLILFKNIGEHLKFHKKNLIGSIN